MAVPGTLNIVYVGSMDPASNSFGRFRTLQKMGHRVTGIDIDKHVFKSPFSSVHYRLNIGPGIYRLSRELFNVALSVKPDLLWLDNKVFIRTSVLRRLKAQLPEMRILGLITDDSTGHAKAGWRLTLNSANLFDCIFVQRVINVKELKQYGAGRVEICYRSFDPSFHRRIDMSAYGDFICDVGFIGTCEEPREEYIAFLIDHGIQVEVTGNDWPGGKRWKTIEPFYKGPSVYGEDYIRRINGMGIALHFLRHSNRDEQDSRTFEIPACGAFMLAERSDLHMKLFEEGREAAFFSSKEELLEKVRYYLQHHKERKEIADAGMAKCHTAGYSHEARLRDVLIKMYEDEQA